MKQIEMSREAADELAASKEYTHDEVIEQIHERHNQWLISVKEHFDGDWDHTGRDS